jgi:hypothetical protein
MREDSIFRFLITLGVEERTIESARGWVNCPCPMAEWTHGSGADERPSFGIRINDEGVSHYYCFGCMPEGRRVDWLLHNIYIMTGSYPFEAAEIFAEEEIHYDEDAKPPKIVDNWKGELMVPPNPLPPEVFTQYQLLQYGKGFEAKRCIEFLEEERRIPRHLAFMYKVRYDDHNSSLIFPLTDYDGGIYLMRARSRKEKSIWTMNNRKCGFPNLEFPRLRDVGAWFGMWLVDWRKPVLAIETEMDVMVCRSFGHENVVAAATSSITEAQMDTVMRAPTVILGFDADKAGEHACKRFTEHARGKVGLMRVDWSQGDAHELASACTDPGDLADKESFDFCMQNAEVIK